jgi:hypothetical protein
LFSHIPLILNRDYNIIVSTRDHGVMKKRLWQTKSWRHDHNIDEEQVSPCPLKSSRKDWTEEELVAIWKKLGSS